MKSRRIKRSRRKSSRTKVRKSPKRKSSRVKKKATKSIVTPKTIIPLQQWHFATPELVSAGVRLVAEQEGLYGLEFNTYISNELSLFVWTLFDPLYRRLLKTKNSIEEIIPLWRNEAYTVKDSLQNVSELAIRIRGTEEDIPEQVNEKMISYGYNDNLFRDNVEEMLPFVSSPAIIYAYGFILAYVMKYMVKECIQCIPSNRQNEQKITIQSLGCAIDKSEMLRVLFLRQYNLLKKGFKERVPRLTGSSKQVQDLVTLQETLFQTVSPGEILSFSGSLSKIQERIRNDKNYNCKMIRLDCSNMSQKDSSLLRTLTDLEFKQQSQFVAYLTLNRDKCDNRYVYFVGFIPSSKNLCGVIQTMSYPEKKCLVINYLTSRAAKDPNFKYTGTRLLDSAVAEAKKQSDIYYIILTADSRAIDFYLKYGFFRVNGQYVFVVKGTQFLLHKIYQAFIQNDLELFRTYWKELEEWDEPSFLRSMVDTFILGIVNKDDYSVSKIQYFQEDKLSNHTTFNPIIYWLIQESEDNQVFSNYHWNRLLQDLSYEEKDKNNKIFQYVLNIMIKKEIQIDALYAPPNIQEYIFELIKDNDTYRTWIRDTWLQIVKYDNNPELETIKNKLEKRIKPDLHFVFITLKQDVDNTPRQYLKLAQQWIKKYDLELNDIFLKALVYINDIEMIKWVFKEYPDIVPSEECIRAASNMAWSENKYELLRLLLSHPRLREKKSWWDRFTSWFS